MKIWLKTCKETLHKYRQDLIEATVTSVLLAACFFYGGFLRGIAANRDITLWRSLVLAPEPEICALCGGGAPYHAPVLVSLSTGEAGEMRVYDPDPRHRYELAEEQSTGTFSLLHVAGLTGYRDTCDHTCHVTLPEEAAPIAPGLFCRDCRALLADTATGGYVLADFSNLSDITVYAIEDGARYVIRDYDVFISTQEETDGLSVHVAGLLPAKGAVTGE